MLVVEAPGWKNRFSLMWHHVIVSVLVFVCIEFGSERKPFIKQCMDDLPLEGSLPFIKYGRPPLGRVICGISG